MCKIFKSVNILFFLVMLLVACSVTESDPKETSDTTIASKSSKHYTNKDKEAVNKNKSISLIKQFTPPNLVIQDFNKKYDKNNNQFILQLNYELSPQLYKLLMKTDYYFFIKYPKKVKSILGTNHTNLIKGPKMKKNNRLDYTVNFKQSLSHNLSENKVNTLINESSNFDLNILNEQKEIVHIFKDIAIAANVETGKSESIILNEDDNKAKSSPSN